jgi:hypothetical protein
MGWVANIVQLCTATIPIVRIELWKSRYFLCIAQKISGCRIGNTFRPRLLQEKSAADARMAAGYGVI